MTRSHDDTLDTSASEALRRIADALEAQVPKPAPAPDFSTADAFVWQAERGVMKPVPSVSRVDIALLKGIDRVRDILTDNTRRFARGYGANNVLLWGARGMGKSSLVKAAHALVNSEQVDSRQVDSGQVDSGQASPPLKLVEIHREDIDSLPSLMALIRPAPFRFLIFCDDLSFDGDDTSYKSLKAVLEGGLEGRPENVIFYATSNRRHLMPREMVDNERATAINPGEAVEEKVSLSDRFGLWLGFHKCSQDEFLAMVFGYAEHYGLDLAHEAIEAEALEWAATRANRSGRTAWQFIQDLAGRMGRAIG